MTGAIPRFLLVTLGWILTGISDFFMNKGYLGWLGV